MAGTLRLEVAPKLLPVVADYDSRYLGAFGGRGSAKSWTVARMLLARSIAEQKRILCTREIQGSIRESVHKLLANQIEMMGMSRLFSVQQHSITNARGSEFIFEGLRHNVNKIKSMEGIDIAWLEEAEKVSDDSWKVLIPTVRKPGSQIVVTFNPDLESDPTYQRFIMAPPGGCNLIKCNWQDNPWITKELLMEKDYLYRVDPDSAAHVWGGECRRNTQALVLSGKYVVDTFEPGADWDGPYNGADWGFSQDPTAGVTCWIKGTRLYIEREAWKIGCELDHTAKLFDEGLGERVRGQVMRADSARPETISYLRRNGYPNLVAASKWQGSVEDGVAHLRQYEQIVIHPRCTHALQEAQSWSYKVDRLTGDVLPELVDANNHIWDAVRYALQPIIKSRPGIIDFYRAEAIEMEKRRNAGRIQSNP